jgi:diacylglycerol kinase (ATP)
VRIAVVVNPSAGGGRMARQWPSFAAALRSRFADVAVHQTSGPGEAIAIARRLAEAGHDLVVAAGGDGTVGEVANGLLGFAEDGRVPPALSVLPAGTGNDFARCFGVPRQPGPWATAIAESGPRSIDAGRVSYADDAGRTRQRYFVSVASVGISGEIDRIVNRSASKRRGGLSGKALFFAFTLRELLRYRFRDVTIRVDDGEAFPARILLVAVANNPSFGGGMLIAPDARPDDGRLDVVVARAASRLSMLRDLRLVYSGRHRRLPSCTFLSGRRIVISPVPGDDAPALLDVDGESPGSIPATFEILDAALVLHGWTR